MIVVVQRIDGAVVKVKDESAGRIDGPGLLVLAGFKSGDTSRDLAWMSDKLVNLRIFPDRDGKMNLCVKDADGGILLVPNFTLYADVRKGRRPSFNNAAGPREAGRLFEEFKACFDHDLNVQCGIFGADMRVELVNSGPVTLVLRSEDSC